MVRTVKHRKRGRGKTPKLKGHGLKMIYDNTLLCKAEVTPCFTFFGVHTYYERSLKPNLTALRGVLGLELRNHFL